MICSLYMYIAVVLKIRSNRQLCPKEDIVGVFDVFNMRWYHQLQSYW